MNNINKKILKPSEESKQKEGNKETSSNVSKDTKTSTNVKKDGVVSAPVDSTKSTDKGSASDQSSKKKKKKKKSKKKSSSNVLDPNNLQKAAAEPKGGTKESPAINSDTKQNNANPPVLKSKSGFITNASNYEDNSSKVVGEKKIETHSTVPSLPLVSYPKSNKKAFSQSSISEFLNTGFSPVQFSQNVGGLGRSQSNIVKAFNLANTKKELLVIIPPTINVSYANEHYSPDSNFFNRYMVSPLTFSERNFSLPTLPSILNVTYQLNLSGYLPNIYNPLVEDITFSDAQFSFSKQAPKGLATYVTGSSSSPQVNVSYSSLSETQTNSDWAEGLSRQKINGMEKGDNPYTLWNMGDFFNNISNESNHINDRYRMDVGTWSKTASRKNFLSNLENAVINDPNWTKFSGLTRNSEIILSIHDQLVLAGTFMRIVFICVKTAKDAGITLLKKLGVLDITFKQLFTSQKASTYASGLQRLASYFSSLPYDKKVVDTFSRYGEWGLLNSKELTSELNPLVIPNFLLCGNFSEESVDLNTFIPFKDNAALSSMLLPKGNMLNFLFSGQKKFFIPNAGKATDGDNSPSNVPAHFKNKVGLNTSLNDVTDSIVISKYRITSFLFNFLASLLRDDIKMDKLEKFFRDAHSFLTLYQIDKILDGTDYYIEPIEIVDFSVFNELTPSIFKDIHILSSAELDTNSHSPAPVLNTSVLALDDYLPAWNLYPKLDDENVTYQNMIGFVWADGSHNTSYDFNDYNGSTSVQMEFRGINLIDSTISPLLCFGGHLMIGYNDGVISHGEDYTFTTGINKTISYLPISFESTYASSNFITSCNKNYAISTPANYDVVGYFCTQSLVPFFSLAKSHSSVSAFLFKYNSWNRLHKSLILDSVHSEYGDLRKGPYGNTFHLSGAQLFRTKLFMDLSPLSSGIAYKDIPTSNECKLGDQETPVEVKEEDKKKSS